MVEENGDGEGVGERRWGGMVIMVVMGGGQGVGGKENGDEEGVGDMTGRKYNDDAVDDEDGERMVIGKEKMVMTMMVKMM